MHYAKNKTVFVDYSFAKHLHVFGCACGNLSSELLLIDSDLLVYLFELALLALELLQLLQLEDDTVLLADKCQLIKEELLLLGIDTKQVADVSDSAADKIRLGQDRSGGSLAKGRGSHAKGSREPSHRLLLRYLVFITIKKNKSNFIDCHEKIRQI
jgi:hypothetical protein